MIENPVYWTREAARYGSDEDLEMFLEDYSIKPVATLDAFAIPESPTWSEDPYTSRTWSLYYYSMGWLFAGEKAYKAGDFDGFPEYLKSMMLSFMDANQDVADPSHDMVWNDACNAFRTATLTYMFDTYVQKEGVITLTSEEQMIIAHGLENHRDQLLYQLDKEDAWAFSNHRFFHAMALVSYASVFGQDETSPYYEENAEDLFEYGMDAVQIILGQVINLDVGVTREQSFAYHRLDLSLVLEAQKYLVADAGYSLDYNYDQVLAEMLEFDLLTRRPNGAVAEIGDTIYGTKSASSYIQQVIDSGLLTPTAKYILSDGVEGVRPTDVVDRSAGGYIIFRPEYKWENERDTRIVFDVSDKRLSHGNYDNTNFIYSAYGQNILIDSGGPYSYDKENEPGLNGTFRNEYFFSSRAHNLLLVDGKNFDVKPDVLKIEDTQHYSFAYVSHAGYAGITVTRGLLVLKDGVVVVLDRADATDGQQHVYELNYHFDPDVVGLDASADGEFQLGKIFVDTAFATDSGASFDIISGRLGSQPQGWVTPALYQVEPSPVLDISQTSEDAWYVSAFAPSLGASLDLTLSATYVDGHMVANLTYDGTVYRISLADDGALVVEEEFKLPTPTKGNDVLQGSNGADTINALSGDDVLSGLLGNDSLIGGTGNDTVNGEGGNDSVYGGAGNDLHNGGDGNDYASGSLGFDMLNGDVGNDTLRGGEDADTLSGGVGDDSVRGDEGQDSVMGDEGNDKLFGDGGDDRLSGGYGFDFLYGGTGNDYLSGQNDNDYLRGDEGNDTLLGGKGDDTLVGSLGADLFKGEAGKDIFMFLSKTDSTVLLTDRVMDFAMDEDRVDVHALHFSSIVSGLAMSSNVLGFSFDVKSGRTILADMDNNFVVKFDGNIAFDAGDFIF